MQATPLSTSSSRTQRTTSQSPTRTSRPAEEQQPRTSSDSGRAASGMSGLEGRGNRSPNLYATRASLPSSSSGAQSQGTSLPNLRESADFLKGIKEEPTQAAGFAEAAQGGHHASLKYIADHVNPNLTYGSVLNAFKAVTGGPMALKQNCVYCSTAADQNLAALVSGNPGSFWIADKTSAGVLPPGASVDTGVRRDAKVSDLLGTQVARGSRAIISVPQRGEPSYNHAMNCVHADDGSLHVIDGQNSKIYDLSLEADKKAFDEKFGHNGGPCVARIFTTGAAPRPPVANDEGEWVHLARS